MIKTLTKTRNNIYKEAR